MQKQNLFEDDFCESCGNRVNVDDLIENNEHWICQKCEDELQEEGERRMAEYDAKFL